MDCSLPGSSVHGIFQARELEWVAIAVSARLTIYIYIQVAQSCLTHCKSMNYRVHGILQARILEWIAVTYSRGDFPGGSVGKVSVYNVGDPGSIPGLGRSPGEGNGNPLQFSCLDNPMDGGAW